MFETMTGFDTDRIMAKVRSNDQLLELVERSIRAASEAASKAKRVRLAHVAAAAVSGSPLAKPDEYPFFVRTIEALEDSHAHLLVLIAKPVLEWGPETIDWNAPAKSEDALRALWPEAGETIAPMLALLVSGPWWNTQTKGVAHTFRATE